MKLKILDLFCGAGGCAKGYYQGFTLRGFDVDITGVDITPQPRYPYKFVQSDAITFSLEGYDFVHASPPCQAFTTMSNRWRGSGGKTDQHINLIEIVRNRLKTEIVGTPYVIENVPGAKRYLHNPISLSGSMFGLRVHRPRLFELPETIRIITPKPVKVPKNIIGVYGNYHDGRLLYRRKNGTELRAPKTLVEAQTAMDINWMEWEELKESVPPPYTKFIAGQIPLGRNCGANN